MKAGHPPGLAVLFFTELWERFSYYGMRALLILYMTNHFLWSQDKASAYYKWYTSLVYFSPLLGGYLADRWLGNRLAVIIGGTLMAIGHFLMAFEQYEMFLSALIFLILGNGFFKPNMSTQVGRLYPEGDARRDSAYTIFYMGINLGALLSPLICGTLGEGVGFHWGFGAAGVGMVLGLIIYLAGQPWVVEVSGSSKTHAVAVEVGASERPAHWLSLLFCNVLAIAGAVLVAASAVGILGRLGWLALDSVPLLSTLTLDNAAALGIAGVAASIMAWIAFQLEGVALDRVTAIYALFLFVMCFWAAFEQAGNVMNIWADKHTARQWVGIEVPATWFQAVNPLLIVLLAPPFAMLWTFLAQKGWHMSIPAKMAWGVFLMGLSFTVMIGAAWMEDRPTETTLPSLPPGLALNQHGQVCIVGGAEGLEPVSFGRLLYDPATGRLALRGVLTDLERDRILRATAPREYRQAVEELVQRADNAAERERHFEVRVQLDTLPKDFDFRYTTLDLEKHRVGYDPHSQSLVARKRLADREQKLLLLAAVDAPLRQALEELVRQSSAFRVSMWWLLVHYLLATAGELCLSPVGLSMVSKLSPARFATMLMGLWLMTSFFGNFIAGAFGEIWGTITPVAFFSTFVLILMTAACILVVLIRPIRKMMHGVN
ncbi:MAG: MFS transporter [Gemmataceae bacterium]